MLVITLQNFNQERMQHVVSVTEWNMWNTWIKVTKQIQQPCSAVIYVLPQMDAFSLCTLCTAMWQTCTEVNNLMHSLSHPNYLSYGIPASGATEINNILGVIPAAYSWIRQRRSRQIRSQQGHNTSLSAFHLCSVMLLNICCGCHLEQI